MGAFAQDLWHDLRAKRLWPVAILLALGIVAIPAVLMKSAATPTTGPLTTAPAEQADGIEVEVAEIAGGGAGSALDTLPAKNPFKPPAGVTKAGDTASASSSQAGAPEDGRAGGAGDQGGDESGGGTTGGGTAPAPVAPEPEPTRTASFEFVVDVTFWANNRRRTPRGLRKLDSLPNQAAPVLIFMGTGPKGGDAVFLVDATLKAAGEGRCEPGPANCAFLHLGPGSEHAFTTQDGDSYRLRIDEIRRVRVGRRAQSARRGARASAGRSRRLSLPALVDLVQVSGTRGQLSEAEDAPSGKRARSR